MLECMDHPLARASGGQPYRMLTTMQQAFVLCRASTFLLFSGCRVPLLESWRPTSCATSWPSEGDPGQRGIISPLLRSLSCWEEPTEAANRLRAVGAPARERA